MSQSISSLLPAMGVFLMGAILGDIAWRYDGRTLHEISTFGMWPVFCVLGVLGALRMYPRHVLLYLPLSCLGACTGLVLVGVRMAVINMRALDFCHRICYNIDRNGHEKDCADGCFQFDFLASLPETRHGWSIKIKFGWSIFVFILANGSLMSGACLGAALSSVMGRDCTMERNKLRFHVIRGNMVALFVFAIGSVKRDQGNMVALLVFEVACILCAAVLFWPRLQSLFDKQEATLPNVEPSVPPGQAPLESHVGGSWIPMAARVHQPNPPESYAEDDLPFAHPLSDCEAAKSTEVAPSCGQRGAGGSKHKRLSRHQRERKRKFQRQVQQPTPCPSEVYDSYV